MSHCIDRPQTTDMRVLLRSHGERFWMISTVLPLVRRLEAEAQLDAGRFAAALAYLEVLWAEARLRAAETDAEFARLQPHPGVDDLTLREKARRYHAAVRRMRESLRRRVERLAAGDGARRASRPAPDRIP